MIRLFSQLIILIISVGLIYPQDFKSIHQIEFEQFYSLKKNIFESDQIQNEILPLNSSINKNVNKTVFGYYPYWEYSNNAHLNFRYDLLTHIALFDFSVSNTGAISNPSNWPWTNVINAAHQNGVKVIMVLVNFNSDDIHNLLTNSTARWVFMNNVKNKISNYNFDGVNVDFEGLRVDDRGNLINGFMKELSDTVHSTFPGKEVSYASPAVNWGGWDLLGLANSCDYLFIMGYDFYGSWSKNSGPTAPLTGGNYNITNTINVQYGQVVKSSPEKLILGVPYFGPHWKTMDFNEGSSILSYVGAERFRSAQPNSETYGIKWSNYFQNSWYSYFDNSFINHQVWFDNSESMALKYDLAISKNLKGIGMWALGYDGTRTELWDLIEEKFVTPVEVNNNIIPKSILLFQNYPNPFNPTTKIKYQIPTNDFLEVRGNNLENTNVSLSVYDLLGREIKKLVNETKSPGIYEVEFNAKDLASGVYFYKLQLGNFVEVKKMIYTR